jgi:hypothetical protein
VHHDKILFINHGNLKTSWYHAIINWWTLYRVTLFFAGPFYDRALRKLVGDSTTARDTLNARALEYTPENLKTPEICLKAIEKYVDVFRLAYCPENF